MKTKTIITKLEAIRYNLDTLIDSRMFWSTDRIKLEKMRIAVDGLLKPYEGVTNV